MAFITGCSSGSRSVFRRHDAANAGRYPEYCCIRAGLHGSREREQEAISHFGAEQGIGLLTRRKSGSVPRGPATAYTAGQRAGDSH